MSDNAYTNTEVPLMPICPSCGERMHYHGVQRWNHKPHEHYCECHTVGCQFGIPQAEYDAWVNDGRPTDRTPKGSTYIVAGWREYVLRAGYSDAQYDAAQRKA